MQLLLEATGLLNTIFLYACSITLYGCSKPLNTKALKSAIHPIEEPAEDMDSNEAQDNLKGTTLETYRFLLKANKPIGARELQRALNFSSPSLAAYHLSKLEEIGLVKNENGEFVIAKVLLEDCIRVSRFLIPRYFFYSIFAIAALIAGLTLLRPATITREYFFLMGVVSICALAFCFETAKTWVKGGL